MRYAYRCNNCGSLRLGVSPDKCLYCGGIEMKQNESWFWKVCRLIIGLLISIILLLGVLWIFALIWIIIGWGLTKGMMSAIGG